MRGRASPRAVNVGQAFTYSVIPSEVEGPRALNTSGRVEVPLRFAAVGMTLSAAAHARGLACRMPALSKSPSHKRATRRVLESDRPSDVAEVAAKLERVV